MRLFTLGQHSRAPPRAKANVAELCEKPNCALPQNHSSLTARSLYSSHGMSKVDLGESTR